MSGADIAVQSLWIERVSSQFGFDKVSETLFGDHQWGPYLFIVTAIGIHLPVLSVVGWVQTGTLSIAVNPGEIFQLIAWPAVVWILLRTKSRYATVVNAIPEAIDEDIRDLDTEGPIGSRLLTLLGVPQAPAEKSEAGLERIAPQRVMVSILFIGIGFYATQLLVNPEGLVGPVAELTGPFVATIRFYLIIPFVLYPIGAEFLTVVVGVLILLPFKIRRAQLIDFSDPHGFAGLSPVGGLFKSVAVSYFVLLTLFTTFQTVAIGASPTDLISSTLLLTGLLAGLVFFFAPMFWIKSFVAAAKEAKIDALAKRSREVGPTDDLFPYAEPESSDHASQHTYNHIRMQRVNATSEFPLNTAMLQEILFALVLPYITSLAFDFVLTNLR